MDARWCVCVCVHPDSKLRVLELTCCFQLVSRAGGRGTHTDSSANKAGLYAVRISLRTLSDVPAEGNGHQAKPKTWHAEGSTTLSDRYTTLLRLIETSLQLKPMG